MAWPDCEPGTYCPSRRDDLELRDGLWKFIESGLWAEKTAPERCSKIATAGELPRAILRYSFAIWIRNLSQLNSCLCLLNGRSFYQFVFSFQLFVIYLWFKCQYSYLIGSCSTALRSRCCLPILSLSLLLFRDQTCLLCR